MVKSAPSIWKIAAMVLFTLTCFGLLLFLWLAFGGPVPLKPKGYRFHTSFAEAGQLSTEADVRISGVPVGKVKTIDADKRTGRADVTIQLDPEYAPLPSDAKAILRQKTLLGETYVELTPGHRSARPIPEGGTLAASQVSDTVELDEIVRTFDPPTRAAFQQWMQAQGQAIGDRGQDLNDALGNLGPFADDTATLVGILNRQEGALSRLISNTGVVFGALNERDGQLRSLIRNTNTVLSTTASRDEELKAAFKALPTFETESQTTLRRLTQFSETTDPLVTQLRPAARELSPTLRDLADVAPDLKNLLEQLQPLIDASKKGFPAAEQVLQDARPLIGQLGPATQQLTPMIQFLSLYKRDMTSFFANAASATQAKDPGTTLHYLRTTNPLNPENLAVYPRRLPTNRPNPYAKPGTFDQLAQGGIPVYEDRQCSSSNLLPSISNVPVGVTNTVTQTVTDVTGGLVQLPPIPQVPLTPDQASALIPADLLQKIQQFAFGGGASAGSLAPPCRKQGAFDFGGEKTQYPHVNALK
ncbi:MlaD family protein [Candidatus Solirubrobacter pratensis]|uniref:MlaD family protein n=1 Tax=Candidatus Solirubrobacter pratensis TaxID=1298857 RepID=UPI00041C3F80|nr:MlaD family protein [Candidatus Solirubrobacter pratensis]